MFVFSACTRLLHELEKLALSRSLDRKIIESKTRQYILEWFDSYASDMHNNPAVLLAIFSTLLPELRYDRVYGMRESTLVKILIKAMGLGNSRRRMLENWRNLTEQGDLGSAVEKVMLEAETSRAATVTVTEVDEMLDRLAGRYIFSSEELREKIKGRKEEKPYWELCELWPRLRSFEGKWLTRLLLKKLDPVMIPGKASTDTPLLGDD
jgi:DNA ligase-4